MPYRRFRKPATSSSTKSENTVRSLLILSSLPVSNSCPGDLSLNSSPPGRNIRCAGAPAESHHHLHCSLHEAEEVFCRRYRAVSPQRWNDLPFPIGLSPKRVNDQKRRKEGVQRLFDVRGVRGSHMHGRGVFFKAPLPSHGPTKGRSNDVRPATHYAVCIRGLLSGLHQERFNVRRHRSRRFGPSEHHREATLALFEPLVHAGDGAGAHSCLACDRRVGNAAREHLRGLPSSCELADLRLGQEIAEESTAFVHTLEADNRPIELVDIFLPDRFHALVGETLRNDG